MAKQVINLGTAPNGAGGDDRRSAWQKAIANFDELYAAVAGVFNRSNIVGTVSQNAGVPTGAILQSGTNANGYWVKYADGTLVCTGERYLGGQTSAAAGGIFYAGPFSGFNFPHPFVGSPKVTINIVSPSGLRWASNGSALPTATSSGAFFVLGPAASIDYPTATYTAIGRWF